MARHRARAAAARTCPISPPQVARLFVVERLRDASSRARETRLRSAERRLLARLELGERAHAVRRAHERVQLVDEQRWTA